MDDLHAPELIQRQRQLFRVNLRSMLGAEELEILTLFGGHNQKKFFLENVFLTQHYSLEQASVITKF